MSTNEIPVIVGFDFARSGRVALMRALATHPVALTVLPPTLNSHKPTVGTRAAVIFHYWRFRTLNKMRLLGRLRAQATNLARRFVRKVAYGVFRRQIMKNVPEAIKNSKYGREFV